MTNCPIGRINYIEVGDIINGIEILKIDPKLPRHKELCWYNSPCCGKLMSAQLRTVVYIGVGKCNSCRGIDVGNRCRNGSVKPLLEDNHTAFYYQGLLYADGHLGHNQAAGGDGINTLVINLSEKDSKYLTKFADFLGTKMRKIKHKHWDGVRSSDQVVISINEGQVVKNLANKMGIFHTNKTYNPPEPNLFKQMDVEKRFSICCGVIDGDGCRNKYVRSFAIAMHISWKDTLHAMFEGLFKRSRDTDNRLVTIHVPLDGYNVLQKHRKKHNLPVLDRKWYDERTRITYEQNLIDGVIL